MKIFIQIAAYRDPELLPTLNSLLKNAKYPKNLSFGLVWQHSSSDAWDNVDSYLKDKRFRVLDIPYEQSCGMGWARSKTQSLYDGEDYTLQIDSHMRFAKNWDASLLKMMNHLHGLSQKPILTGYAFQYEPNRDNILTEISSTLCPIAFKKNGILFFKSFANKPNQYSRPYRARLVGGHFLFTLGKHCREYAYDPNLYYVGDEWTLSIRSYTLGYDLYHPNKNVLWHYYKRSDCTKPWLDQKDAQTIAKEEYNIKRIQQLTGQDEHGINLENYGLGNNRSISDYEEYSGIYIKDRRILSSAMIGQEPPTGKNDKNFVKNFEVEIKTHPREFILNFHKNKSIDKIKIDLIALDESLLETKTITIKSIQNNNSIFLEYIGEKKPMKYNMELYHNNETSPKIRVCKDLEEEIQWN